MDEATPFFVFDGIRNCQDSYELVSAKAITAGCQND